MKVTRSKILVRMEKPPHKDCTCEIWIERPTVKHLFARTLFSRKFARAERRENKFIAYNL